MRKVLFRLFCLTFVVVSLSSCKYGNKLQNGGVGNKLACDSLLLFKNREYYFCCLIASDTVCISAEFCIVQHPVDKYEQHNNEQVIDTESFRDFHACDRAKGVRKLIDRMPAGKQIVRAAADLHHAQGHDKSGNSTQGNQRPVD